MIKKEILQRLEYLNGVLNAGDDELKERFPYDFKNQETKNEFLMNTTKIIIKDLIIDLARTIQPKEIIPFTDNDLIMLNLSSWPDLNLEVGIPGGNDDE